MRTVPDGTKALRWAVLGAAATAAGGHHSDPDVDAAIRRRKGQRGARTKKQGAVILNNDPTGIGKAYQIAEALGDAYERVLTGKIAPGLVAYIVTPMNYQREEIRQALDAR